MALLFWEGFDSYSSISQLMIAKPHVQGSYYTAFGSIPEFTTNAGRFGGCAGIQGYWTGWGLINISGFANPTELYTGRAVRVGGDNGLICFWGNAGGTGYADVFLYCASGFISAYRVNASDQNVLLGTAPVGNFTINTWHWLEARCKMSTNNASNDGIVEVWLNNQLIISNTSCTTKRSNTSTYYMGTNLITGTTTNTPSCYWDDIYITDTSGPAPWNGRLGDLRIATVSPNFDVGANSGTPSTGSTHWGVIDERPYNTSDYLTIPNTPGNKETFYINKIPTIANSIFGVSVVSVQQKSDAGASNSHTVLVSNNSGYVSNSNTRSLSTSWAIYVDDFVVNPESNTNWTYADFSNTQIGLVIDN